MPAPTRLLAAFAALVVITAPLAACQNQRNEFNPVRMICPGDFDPQANECVIQTGG
jgi:hypothetical protein